MTVLYPALAPPLRPEALHSALRRPLPTATDAACAVHICLPFSIHAPDCTHFTRAQIQKLAADAAAKLQDTLARRREARAATSEESPCSTSGA